MDSVDRFHAARKLTRFCRLQRPESEADHVCVAPLESCGDGTGVAVHQGERDDESGNREGDTHEGGERGTPQKHTGSTPQEAQSQFELQIHRGSLLQIVESLES
jgi:uncharacterized sporulation protein YeaH/YhbH (DUF444 family)